MVYMLVSKSKLFSLSPYIIQKKYVYEKPVLAFLSSWENYYFHSQVKEWYTVNDLRLWNFAFRNKLLLHYTVFGHLQKTSFVVLHHEDSKSLSCYCQILGVLCIIWSAFSIYNLHFLLELLYQMTYWSRSIFEQRNGFIKETKHFIGIFFRFLHIDDLSTDV